MTPRGLWFEEFAVGQVYHTAAQTLSRDEALAFARDWDPQPFHLDDVAAAKTVFGRIIVSGIHTVAVTSRLIFDTGVLDGTAIAGLGLDQVRFHAPVFPGDRLTVTFDVIGLRPSANRNSGTVKLRLVTRNQKNAEVYSAVLSVLVAGRPADLSSAKS